MIKLSAGMLNISLMTDPDLCRIVLLDNAG